MAVDASLRVEAKELIKHAVDCFALCLSTCSGNALALLGQCFKHAAHPVVGDQQHVGAVLGLRKVRGVAQVIAPVDGHPDVSLRHDRPRLLKTDDP